MNIDSKKLDALSISDVMAIIEMLFNYSQELCAPINSMHEELLSEYAELS